MITQNIGILFSGIEKISIFIGYITEESIKRISDYREIIDSTKGNENDEKYYKAFHFLRKEEGNNIKMRKKKKLIAIQICTVIS
jgi:hypothetical protein